MPAEVSHPSGLRMITRTVGAHDPWRLLHRLAGLPDRVRHTRMRAIADVADRSRERARAEQRRRATHPYGRRAR